MLTLIPSFTASLFGHPHCCETKTGESKRKKPVGSSNEHKSNEANHRGIKEITYLKTPSKKNREIVVFLYLNRCGRVKANIVGTTKKIKVLYVQKF